MRNAVWLRLRPQAPTRRRGNPYNMARRPARVVLSAHGASDRCRRAGGTRRGAGGRQAQPRSAGDRSGRHRRPGRGGHRQDQRLVERHRHGEGAGPARAHRTTGGGRAGPRLCRAGRPAARSRRRGDSRDFRDRRRRRCRPRSPWRQTRNRATRCWWDARRSAPSAFLPPAPAWWSRSTTSSGSTHRPRGRWRSPRDAWVMRASAFVIALRDGHDDPLQTAAALGERCVQIRLAGLSLGATRHLLRARNPQPIPHRDLRRIHERAAGNPFFALEIARATPEGDRLPTTLRELVQRRLESARPGLPAIELLAVLGPMPVSAFPDPAALDAAVTDGVLVERDGEVRFAHPLLAAGAYERIPPARRRELHRHAAASADALERRARHLALAATGPDPDVALVLDDAARSARARGAPEAAAELAAQAGRADAAGRRCGHRSPDGRPGRVPPPRWRRGGGSRARGQAAHRRRPRYDALPRPRPASPHHA